MIQAAAVSENLRGDLIQSQICVVRSNVNPSAGLTVVITTHTKIRKYRGQEPNGLVYISHVDIGVFEPVGHGKPLLHSALKSVRIPSDRSATTTYEKVKIHASVGLKHVVHIQPAIPTVCERIWPTPCLPATIYLVV